MRTLPAIVLLLGAAVACQRASANDSDKSPPSPPAQPTIAVAQSQSADSSRQTAITRAVARVAPSVVTVQTESVDTVRANFFDMFWGGRSGLRRSAGLGTGFVIRSDGVIMTNAHVVAGATKVSVMMRDGTVYDAKILGQDQTNDLAVIRIDAKNLPTAPLGDSDHLIIGEWAIAIGNPFGFALGNSEPSVTAGVISATGRNLVGPGEGGGVYVDMIQTDASINPGNSGGPLVDALGEVIGVNSSIYTPSSDGGSVGLGFAIPIDRATRVADDLIEHGVVRRPWIGELLQPVSQQQDPRAAITSGVILRGVVPGSPAEHAGLRAGDQIVQASGRNLRNDFDWEAVRLTLRVGDTVPLEIKRGSREFSVNVTVADRPEVTAPKVTVLKEIELTTLTATLRAERSIRSGHGALVTSVSSRVRDEIGLQQGDVIVQINGTDINTAADVARVLNASRGPTRFLMYFERGGVMYRTDFVVR